MSTIQIGKKVPAFKAPATGEKTITSSDLKDHNAVIYFYPKDNTPGCTVEGQEFAELHSKFKRQNTIILGVSRDSIKSHENFKDKFDFPFELLSDSDETLCQLFDVIKEKNMYGKKVMGIERSTFLIGPDGKQKHEWRKVKAKGHAQEVLDTVKNLNKYPNK